LALVVGNFLGSSCVKSGWSAGSRWSVSGSGSWYDVTVSAAGVELRFAGRMETGNRWLSEPAMGE